MELRDSSAPRKFSMRKIWMMSIVGASMCQSAFAETFIRCTSADKDVVTITLDSVHKFSSSLNCIAGKFVIDLTPCAPNGGFGLSSRTGIVSLVGVAKRWQDYGSHLGGVTGNRIDDSTIWFNGGFMVPNRGFHQGWSFSVDRLTGDAVLKTFNDDLLRTKEGTVSYSCSAAARKF